MALGLSVEKSESDPATATIRVGVLHPNPTNILSTIKAAVDVTMGLAKTVSVIYPEAFKRAGLPQAFNTLREHSAGVFKERARVLRQEKADSARARPE